MGRSATREDFERGGLYSSYRRYPFFAQRADFIVERFDPRSVIVAGCGWGYLVDELVSRGVDAWGIDISPYALAKAREVLPSRSVNRVLLGDAAAPSIDRRFDLAVTEDMLPVCGLGEIYVVRDALRASSERRLHIVTCGGAIETPMPLSEWVRVLGPDTVMDAESGEVI